MDWLAVEAAIAASVTSIGIREKRFITGWCWVGTRQGSRLVWV